MKGEQEVTAVDPGAETRVRVDLCKGWSFVRRHVRRSRLWADMPDATVVDLPHCWNAEDGFRDGVEYYRGPGVYTRGFRLPDLPSECQNVRWILVSEGFYGTGDVWLNGRSLAKVDGQYLGFRLDVTRELKWGADNRIALRLTNRCARHVLPGNRMPDFLLYGGLSGRLWLECVSDPCIDAETVCVTSERVAVDQATVRIAFSVAGNTSLPISCTALWRLRDSGGNLVAESKPVDIKMAAGQHRDDCAVSLRVKNPCVWSTQSPDLYIAEGVLQQGDRVLDCVKRRFGIREAGFERGKGFFLNGRRLPLRGCNRHESTPGHGNALPESVHRHDAELIKQAGMNFVRLSHYPQHPSFLDACDELGILVYAEIASWKSVRGGRWLKAACRQLHDMIQRDRNHPCVILWGMGNEARHRGAYTRLRALAHALDPTRPVTYAENHLYRARRRKTTGIPDVWGCNYELDCLEEGLRSSRLGAVIVSECSNYPHAVRGDAAQEAHQLEMIRRDIAKIESLPYVAGFALWSFNDYATLRKKRYKRHCGIVDAWRQPKQAFNFLAELGSAPEPSPVDEKEAAAPVNPTRVAHIHTSLDWGGGENQVLELVAGLTARKVACTLFADPRGKLFAAATGLDAVELCPLSDLGKPGTVGIDLVHAHDSRALTLGHRLARKRGVPLVLARRVASPLRRNPLSRLKYSAGRIDAVIAISETVKAVFSDGGYPPDRIHVVPDGIDIAALDALQEDADFKQCYAGGRLVGGVGRLSVGKNWQFMVQVAARLRDCGRDLRWVLLGDGPERDRLQRLVDDSGLSDRFQLLGFREDAARLMKSFDALFFPSLREGASVTVREAMVLGVPVVAVDAPGTMESLDGHGWAVRAGDVESAATALMESLFDDEKRDLIRQEARASAVERFGMKLTIDGTISVYDSLCATCPGQDS